MSFEKNIIDNGNPHEAVHFLIELHAPESKIWLCLKQNIVCDFAEMTRDARNVCRFWFNHQLYCC